jgi:hypothetical protein
MAIIEVGPSAINRASATAAGNTVIDLANPANDTGNIDTLTCYVASATTNCKIGIFYLVSGTTYKCRSSYNAGSLGTGLNTFTGLSLSVQAGDFIGVYTQAGTIDRADSGGTSCYVVGEYCDAGDQASYTTSGQARIISVHGSGSTTTSSIGILLSKGLPFA